MAAPQLAAQPPRHKWGLPLQLRTSISNCVRGFKTMLTLLLLANWFACMVHCQMEQTGLFHEAAAYSANDVLVVSDSCQHESHVCDWLISGGVQVSDARVAAPEFVALPLAAFLQVALSDAIELSDPGGYDRSSDVPPELSSSVHFVLRTALPARAPSLAS